MIKIKPVITEKSIKLSEKSWYSLKAPVLTKSSDIHQFILNLTGKKPLRINSFRSKSVSGRRGRFTFDTKSYKIFRVKMPQGAVIPGFEIKTENKK